MEDRSLEDMERKQKEEKKISPKSINCLRQKISIEITKEDKEMKIKT